ARGAARRVSPPPPPPRPRHACPRRRARCARGVTLCAHRAPQVASREGTDRGRRGAAVADVVESTEIPGVWLIRPEIHTDERGRFLETYRSSWLPFSAPLVQVNRSESKATVLLGLPFPSPRAQGNRTESKAKVLPGHHHHRRQADLWFVQQGKVTTVLVDTRIGSPTEGKHTTIQQGGGEELAVYIPEGVAHGFYAHDDVIMTYLVTGEYDGTDELGIAWNDPDLGISWPEEEPVL